MKKLNNNYEAPQVEWVELFSENVIMTAPTGSYNETPGSSW